MSEIRIVMYDSQEAATFKTGLSGWVSAAGNYYVKDEHMARWDGCTHIKCDCGNNIHKKTWTCCEECRRNNDLKRYLSMPEVPFDQVECCKLWEDDKFLFSHEDVEEYLEENELTPEDIRLEVCEAVEKLSYVDAEQWNDELPEEWELPDEIQKALDALNAAIKYHSPTIWRGNSKRTTFKKSTK